MATVYSHIFTPPICLLGVVFNYAHGQGLSLFHATSSAHHVVLNSSPYLCQGDRWLVKSTIIQRRNWNPPAEWNSSWVPWRCVGITLFYLTTFFSMHWLYCRTSRKPLKKTVVVYSKVLPYYMPGLNEKIMRNLCQDSQTPWTPKYEAKTPTSGSAVRKSRSRCYRTHFRLRLLTTYRIRDVRLLKRWTRAHKPVLSDWCSIVKQNCGLCQKNSLRVIEQLWQYFRLHIIEMYN